jgi:very-short-patch-repair endonuclease
MPWIVVLAVAVLFVLGFLASLKKRETAARGWPVFAKQLLSEREQVLFGRLARALPGHRVLAQVALSQMVGVKKGANYRAVSNRYYRLVADFVVCKPDFSILAVVELDDRYHDHPRRQDADRRKTDVLQAAGIPIFRVNGGVLPSEEELASMLIAGATAAQSMPPLYTH